MTNIYSEIYNLIIGLFGGSASGYVGEFICQLISCFCVLFVIFVPFIIVFRVIRTITG